MKTILLFLSLAFIFVGCGLGDANDEAIELSKKFHEQMKKQNTDGMLSYVHEDGFATNPKEEWRELFDKIHTIGKIKSIKKDSGFNSKVNNGVHTVTLNYTIEGEVTTLSEQIIWQSDKNDKLKIIGIDFKEK